MNEQNGQRQRFADVLSQYVNRQGHSLGQLARRSGIPKRTIANWIAGQVRKPRYQTDLVKLARALHLTACEADEVLQSVGYPTVEELIGRARRQPDEELLSLLAPWVQETEQRNSPPPSPCPFQAIADLPHFVGRERELEALEQALLVGQHATLYSLEGMGGVGKTTLAAHLAYRVRPHFPDGVLWARLDLSDAMAILGAFAAAYGRDVSAYTDLGSRSQVVREILAHKRALIVLDDARSSEEIAPLLPPSGDCVVIVTTRRRDLAVMRQAHRLHLGPFDRARQESLSLFDRVLGAERTQGERVTLVQIADLLGHLPLAVDIAASRLAYEPGWTAANFLERLRREKRRLDELRYEDLSVRASFNLSYDTLPPHLQQFFAALGVFEGQDFAVAAAAYVAETSVELARDHLITLYGLSLVQEGRPGRYRLHPLLHDYARERIGADAPFERMVECFVRYAERHRLDGDALDLESGNLLAALHTAHARGMPAALVRGANALAHFLEVRGLYDAAELHLNRARQAADAVDDTPGLARVHLNLGRLAQKRGRYGQAQQYFVEGLALARRSGDRVTVSALLGSWGWLVMMCGEYARAEGYFREALALARELGHRERISTLLADLGVLADFRGDYDQAASFYQESLALAREIGHRARVSDVLINLGALAVHHREYEQAERYYRESLALAREIDYRENLSSALENMGEMARRQGDRRRAERLLQEGLTLARELGQRDLIVRSLRHLGRLFEECGRDKQAEACCREGLALAREMDRRVDVGATLGVLGTLAARRGEHAQAEACFREGLALGYELEDAWLIGEILYRWGELHLERRELERASAAFLQSAEAARQAQLDGLVGLALYGLARAEALRGHAAEAQRLGRESLAALEAVGHRRASEIVQWLGGLIEAA